VQNVKIHLIYGSQLIFWPVCIIRPNIYRHETAQDVGAKNCKASSK